MRRVDDAASLADAVASAQREAGSAFVNATLYHLLRGAPPAEAVGQALEAVDMPSPLRSTSLPAASARLNNRTLIHLLQTHPSHYRNLL